MGQRLGLAPADEVFIACNFQQDIQRTYKATLRHVRATNAAVEKQLLHTQSICL